MFSNQGQFKWAVAAILAVCGAYAFSARFMGFIGAPRSEKIIILAVSILGFGLLSSIIFIHFQKRLTGTSDRSIPARLILFSAFMAASLILFLNNPPFPENHTLEITIPDSNDTNSSFGKVRVVAIDRIYQPGGEHVPIDVSELSLSGDWQTLPDNSILWEGGTAGVISYKAVMQAGVAITFESGPGQGQVIVKWDGSLQRHALSDQSAPDTDIYLQPAYNWLRADSARKFLVGTARLAEFLALSTLFVITGLWIRDFIVNNQVVIRNPGTVIGITGILTFLLLISSILIQSVEFKDPNLEILIRETIHNQDHAIFQHQLLTIARLDGSRREITSLEGIQHLRNLSELILRENQIVDIHPLSRLRQLIKLDLRANNIQDLTPLARIKTLTHLNLHSNPEIQSILPLADLSNLQSLILANIPVGQQVDILYRFPNLKHLNLRNTGVVSILPLTNLTELEYLNLHSNAGISSIAPLQNLDKLETLILQNVPVGDDGYLLQNFTRLEKLNLRNSGIADTVFLGELMEAGTLQDDIPRGIWAAVDIRDNPLNVVSPDKFAPIRSHWGNIYLRTPFTLPEYATLNPPDFSRPAGFYQEAFFLELSSENSNGYIHYTLDGSEPTRSSDQYSGQIFIQKKQGGPDALSEIPLTPSWKEPVGETFMASVVRAKVINHQTGEFSPTFTSTYFVDQNIEERYQLPVVSISTEPGNFFDYYTGIYVPGYIYDRNFDSQLNFYRTPANYHQQGDEWERPIHFEFFEAGGIPTYNSPASVKIHGGGSRRLPQKSLRLYAADNNLTRSSFYYNIFPGWVNRVDSKAIQKFNNLILWNSGQDWNYTLFRDPLIQGLLLQNNLETQPYRPVVVFLNGEYWGIHNLRQRADEYYLASLYNLDPDKVTILQSRQVLFRGDPKNRADFLQMLEFVKNSPLNVQDNYQTIQTKIDINNYVDYLIVQIYAANTDWPHNNYYTWRYLPETVEKSSGPGKDSRWRWVITDTDYGFGYFENLQGFEHDTLSLAMNGQNNGILFTSLLRNLEFKDQFINRLADLLNTSFLDTRVFRQIDRIHDEIEPQMEEHIRRWGSMGNSIENWEDNVEVLREFARERPDHLRQHVVDFFGLLGTANLSLRTDPHKGYILVNTLSITSDTPGVEDPSSWTGEYFMGVPIRVTAVPYPGYQFAGWQGLEQDNTTPEISLTLTADLLLKAIFKPIP